MQRVENDCRIRDTADMEYSLEQMARSLVESGDYRVPVVWSRRPNTTHPIIVQSSSLPSWMWKPPARIPIATGLLNLALASSNMTVRPGGSTRLSAPGEWLEDPGFSIPPEITKITGITDQMVAGHRIDDGAVNDLLSRVVLVIAHMRISTAAS
jgi:DNA polymerase III epsilon subunit-like protein